MNYSRSIVIASLFFCLTSAAFAEEEKDSPKQFITDWASAFQKNDHKVLLDFYDQSEDVELIVSAGIRLQGYREIQKALKNDFGAVTFSDSKVKKVSVRKLGETALVAFEHRFKMESKNDGQRLQVHIQTTSVLNRKDGSWKIVLEHSSPIKGIQRYAPIIKDLKPAP